MICQTFSQVIPGAARINQYLPLITGKRIGLVANQTSLVEGKHLLDTLLARQEEIVKVFTPEHGLRGNIDAGVKVEDGSEGQGTIKVISLYGKKLKPAAADLKNLDIVLFDLQDVGVRFYTYISTLTYMLEACAEYHIPMVVLDRPNPNGFYVDGPVLEHRYRSFVGLHPVPVVYGMTIGEYALMVNGEGWLKHGLRADLHVIPCAGYTHRTHVHLPVKPSPNLPNMQSIYLYPSLAFFEGTVISMGRGTSFPFQVYGHPHLQHCSFHFTPQNISGLGDSSYRSQECYGVDLRKYDTLQIFKHKKLILDFLLNAYRDYPDKSVFFNTYFNLLAGNATLQQQIRSGVPEDKIRESWEPALQTFRILRQKYLIYPDFE